MQQQAAMQQQMMMQQQQSVRGRGGLGLGNRTAIPTANPVWTACLCRRSCPTLKPQSQMAMLAMSKSAAGPTIINNNNNNNNNNNGGGTTVIMVVGVFSA